MLNQFSRTQLLFGQEALRYSPGIQSSWTFSPPPPLHLWTGTRAIPIPENEQKKRLMLIISP